MSCPVSLADCTALATATAIVIAETIATSDTDLARLARPRAVPLEEIANPFGVLPLSESAAPAEVAPSPGRRTRRS